MKDMEFGLDEEMETESSKPEDMGTKKEKTEIIAIKKKRAPFAYWNVGGEEHKLKLTTAVICKLEEKLKCNLFNVLNADGGIPPLAVMLTITQGAMSTWEHGIKYADVQGMFDKYCDEGGTQLSFMTDVLMPIYQVSGFFSATQAEAMEERIQDAKELM